MSRIGITIIAVFLFAALCGCTRTLPIALPDNVSVQLVVFVPKAGSSDAESKEIPLSPTSHEYRRLQEWFARNQSGWSQAYPTRPTGGIFVHAGDLHLQFVGNKVLLFGARGHFQKKIREEEYAFLKPAAGI